MTKSEVVEAFQAWIGTVEFEGLDADVSYSSNNSQDNNQSFVNYQFSVRAHTPYDYTAGIAEQEDA